MDIEKLKASIEEDRKRYEKLNNDKNSSDQLVSFTANRLDYIFTLLERIKEFSEERE